MEPSICLCMIVNNEEHVIERCLNSVYPYIKYWVINDNGSTDKTPDIITKFFKDKGIPGILNRDGWKGFSYNRTLAFQIAEKESGCDWMYVIDADDYLETPLKIPPYPSNAHSFIINLQEGPNVMQTRQQLFKVGCQWGYAGAVHEYPYSRIYDGKKIIVGKTTDITVRASRGGARNQDPLKYWKDAVLMEKDIERIRSIPKEKLPHWEKNLEARYCYYICQSWHDFGRNDYAIKWADERVKHVGFKEEVYRAYLLKARCMRKLSLPQNQIIKAIQECINYDKYRAEAYYEMVHQYVQHKQWEKAWEWVKPTMKMKRPKDKLFIVEDFTYEFGAKKEASWVAHHLGHYNESYKIANDLCETYSLDKQYRSWAYNIKHKNVSKILDDTTTYNDKFKQIKCSGKEKIVVNFEFTDLESSIKSLSSFLNCTTDYIHIDDWYCSAPKELAEKFPFLKSGKGSGDITINFSGDYHFFHRCELLSELQGFNPQKQKVQNTWAKKQYEKALKKKNKKQIEKFKKILDKEVEDHKKVDDLPPGPKVVYLNRNGEDVLFTDEMPSLFDRGNGKLVLMEKVAKSPYVTFKEGDGMWSLERVSCLNKNTKL